MADSFMPWCGTCPPDPNLINSIEAKQPEWEVTERSPDEPTETDWFINEFDDWNKLNICDFLDLVDKLSNKPNDEVKYKMLEKILPFLNIHSHKYIWTHFTNTDVAKKVFDLLQLDESTSSTYIKNIVKRKYFRINGEVLPFCKKNTIIIRDYPEGTIHITDRWFDGESCIIKFTPKNSTYQIERIECLHGKDILLTNTDVIIK